MEPIREKIVLEMDAGSVKGNSLEGLIKQLDAVELHIQKVNAALGGMKLGPGAARSVAVLEDEIKRLQGKLGTGLKVGDLSKALGVDQGAFEQFLARQKRNLEGYKSQLQEFRSARQAALAISKYERESVLRRTTLGDLLTPKAAAGSAPAASGPATATVGSARVEGVVTLVIPASQVQASVAGPIAVTGVSGAGGGGAAAGGGAGGGGGGKKGGKAGLTLGGQAGELGRVRTETEKYLREAITAVDAAGDIITTTHDSVEGIIKTSTKHVSGQAPGAAYRDARRLAEENFKQAKAALDPNDPGFGLARVLDKQAAQMRTLLTPALRGNLGAVQAQSIENLLKESAGTLEEQAKGSRVRATAAIQEQARRDFGRRKKDAAQRAQAELTASRAEMEAGLKEVKAGTAGAGVTATSVYQERARRLRGALGAPSAALVGPSQRRQIEAAIRSAEAAAVSAMPVPPVLPKTKPSKFEREQQLERNRMERGLRSFTPQGFATNFLNVAGWAAAVTALYKGFELVEHSLARFLELGRQTAQLSQVFRGVGGSVQEVTEDILKLASAEGRGTEEGMASAKEWARLGLTRKQVNEAVRVSMEAANVADMHTTETTKQLSSIMHVYGMEVGDLAGVLGILVGTSQRYNVTLEDLFLGLDRSAGVAKQAGMSLAELQGMIGAVVGKTGQSGVVVGNTLKSILVQFNNPEMQKFLRGFRIETTTKEGAQKGGSQVLREMFVEYQRLNNTERQNLTMRVAGRLQASRFVALMDNYIQSQKLAIEGQLHLNTAQEANARILGTIKAQLAGVRSEWDRFIVGTLTRPGPGGSPSLGEDLGTSVRTVKNVMRLGNNVALPGLARGIGGALLPLVQGISPGISMGAPWVRGSVALLNHFMESPLERGQAKFANEVQQRGNAAAGYLSQRNLFETASEALGNATTGERRNLIAEQVASLLGARGGELKGLVANGNVQGAQDLLHGAAKESQGKALYEKMQEIQVRNKRMTEAGAEAAAAQAEIAQLERAGGSTERLTGAKERLAEAQQTINELTRESSDLMTQLNEEDVGEIGQAFARKQEYVNLLKEQQTVMEAIGQLAGQQTLETASSRNEALVSGLAEQKAMLDATASVLEKRNEPGMESHGPLAEIRKQQREVAAEIAARSSPRMTEALAMMDDRALAARRAGQEGEIGHVGRTEGEKLLNQERFLREQLAPNTKSRSVGLNENETVRAKEFEIQLYRTQEQIQTRILELARQERQIRIDAAREFQKNLLLAGPGEQLQRLYVGSLLQRKGGLGAGEFNALSPELKRMYYEGRGGQAGALAREEQALLGGRAQSIEEQQTAQREAGKRVRGLGDNLALFERARLSGFPATTALPTYAMDQAKAAGEQLAVMAKAAVFATQTLDAVNTELQRFGAILMGMNGGHGKPVTVTAAPKIGLVTGHSLGSMAASFLPFVGADTCGRQY